MKSRAIIGVDTGGTFTDFVCVDGERVRIHKIPSTPADPTEAILRGLSDLLGEAASRTVLYGTTVATNALIQRKGATTALLTTAGFEDVIEIGRQAREKIYDMNVLAPRPIVGRALRFGVRERVMADGTVVRAVSRTAVHKIARLIRRKGVESVAVCFLHSYVNPANELAAKAALSRHFGSVSISFDVLPEYREYERFSTTCANAYVAPLLREHVRRLEAELRGSNLLVMQSNGGLASAARAGEAAVRSVLSGPAAGVIGAFGAARNAGLSRVITFDMGGTSTDVSLCDGRIGFRTDAVVGGCPIKTPIVDVHTVGAGGGSIARIDRGGALRVGPESAGADPGPACYGKGENLTVTDANLLLGRLSREHFLGGRMPLYPERARKAVRIFSDRLALNEPKTAEAVLDVANATMIRAIRVVSVERGYDPSEFALVAFGGAAPLHAVELARELSIGRILVPTDPGVLSARGLLGADIVRDYSRTVLYRAYRNGSGVPDVKRARALEREFKRLETLAGRYLLHEGVPDRDAVLQRYLDVRYVGQSYEITVPFGEEFERAFHAMHRKLYGHSSPDREIEVVNVRVRAIGKKAHPSFRGVEDARLSSRASPRPYSHSSSRAQTAAAAGVPRFGGRRFPLPVRMKDVCVSGRFRNIPLYERDNLVSGSRFRGPALVVEESSTTYVPGDAECAVDARGNLILKT
jgi:N-methylhydantoinase A